MKLDDDSKPAKNPFSSPFESALSKNTIVRRRSSKKVPEPEKTEDKNKEEPKKESEEMDK